MLVTNLSVDLAASLKDADELWLATALINDEGFKFLQSNLPAHTVQHILVGIDLPTTVSVLKTILSRLLPATFEGRICRPEAGVFHPKTYVIRRGELYIAFVGSANLTLGGLMNNTELCIKIDDLVICRQLLTWFRNLYDNSFPINDENIARYEKVYNSNSSYEALRNSRKVELIKLAVLKDIFDDVDFSDRYFKREHHFAFRPALWKDDSFSANKEREKTSRRFLQLHGEIYPLFGQYGLGKLRPNVKGHVVSMSYHFPGQTQQNINAMWLSYGKSEAEIKKYHELFTKVSRYDQDEENDKQSFINHARLQIRIELHEIGIWILFGKNNNGSLFDRKNFHDKMQEEPYRNSFYYLLTSLPAEYWISVNRVDKPVSDFTDPMMLFDFCKTDNPLYYFIIGRDYKITDPEMSEDNLPHEVLSVFELLNPLYEKMRHYL